jgi:hypothetical protein
MICLKGLTRLNEKVIERNLNTIEILLKYIAPKTKQY